MRDTQIECIEQCRELFKSANSGNPIHWELAKYIFKNMNSVHFAIENGWMNGAGADDLEYADAYIALRDEFKDMYSDFDSDAKGNYVPTYCDELTVDLLETYDFSTHVGRIILGMMNVYYKTQYNLVRDTPEQLPEGYLDNLKLILDKLVGTAK
ncbi:hypothetical protein DQT32_04160 [Salmonella enterica subsp. enterica serovar Braenderup]|nr:hypothetical protein [Salmonella enterica subsp. enterica serovar Braenderup]